MRRNLLDDSRVESHSLEAVLSTLMDIQVQTFSLDDNVPALGYQTKYQLKNEPQTTVQLGVMDSHNAMTYLKGQFVSIMAAAAHVLGNTVTDATWNRVVQAMPSWQLDQECQGHWRRYCTRLPYWEIDLNRPGYSATYSAKAVCAAILMSRFDTINRYLGAATATDGNIVTDPTTGCQFRQLSKTTLPAKLDRQCIDKEEDDITHPAFQPVLSDLLPGHRFVHKYSSLPSDAYRTLKTENLQYTRFWEHDLTIKKDAKGVPNRTKHFWNRLFRSLPWSCADQKEMGFVTPALPADDDLELVINDWHVSTIEQSAFWKNDVPVDMRAMGCLLYTSDAADE